MSFVGSILKNVGIPRKQDVHDSKGVEMTTDAACPYCKVVLGGSYKWNGMVVNCPSCGSPIVLQYLEFNNRSEGYAITYKDFVGLLLDKDVSTDGFRALVSELLSCKVSWGEGRVLILDRNSALIPLEVAHFEIQNDPRKQYEIYQAAMSVWR